MSTQPKSSEKSSNKHIGSKAEWCTACGDLLGEGGECLDCPGPLTVEKTVKLDVGCCYFCTSSDEKVYSIKSNHPDRRVVMGLCARCLGYLGHIVDHIRTEDSDIDISWSV